MSRAAVSKSRAEKGGKPPAAQTPIVSHEIVPGKFNDHDWNVMLDKDGAEDFVEEIVDDLICHTLDKCYEVYLERQLLPFTITEAKEAILSIIEWQFLARDEGEQTVDTDPGWIQDEEPDPAVTDCWAQGSVPRNYIHVPTPVVEEVLEELEGEAVEEEEKDVIQEEEEPAELEDKVSVTEEQTQEQVEREATEEKQKEEEQKESLKAKKKPKFKPHKGRLKSPGLRMTESLEQTEMSLLAAEIEATYPPQENKVSSGLVTMPLSCHSILKVQAGRPPGNKDVEYDDFGNVIAVVKLNPERLPSHRVKVSYQVVDPSVEAAQARLEAMRTGRYKAKTVLKRKSTEKVSQSTSQTTVQEGSVKSTTTKTPLPPPLIETMDIAPGVTVKEGGRMKQGPARYIRRIDLLGQSTKGLKPVSTQITSPRLDVSDILDRQTPILRPIHDAPPLPPIVPHPPTQPKIST